jgi:hypothetical protein
MKTLNKIAIIGALAAGLSACDLDIAGGPSLTCNDPLVIGVVKEAVMEHYVEHGIGQTFFTTDLNQYDVRSAMQIMADETSNTFVCNATLEVIGVGEYLGGGVKRIVYQVVEGEEEFSVEVRGL